MTSKEAFVVGSTKESNGYVGIMIRQTGGITPFAERAFYRRLSLAGKRMGVKVFVFSPDWIDWKTRSVRAFSYMPANKSWSRENYPLPALIYDRAFFRTREQQRRHEAQVSKLLSIPGVRLLGLGLTGKWSVYQMLKKDEEVAQALPLTELYKCPSALLPWLKKHESFIMKPNGSMHGKGVFRVSRVRQGLYEISGRDGANRLFRRRFSDAGELLRWIHRVVVRGRTYLVQQYLSLSTDNGFPFDIRALVQKTEDGGWSLTGTVVRIGLQGSLTSNLHGGGTANEAEPFLKQEYGEEKAVSITTDIRNIALSIPPILEQNHGPLLELGIDFGVDRLGRIWILEINSKPGRSSFTRLSDKGVRITAVTSPIRYARYVLDRQLGGHKQ